MWLQEEGLALSDDQNALLVGGNPELKAGRQPTAPEAQAATMQMRAPLCDPFHLLGAVGPSLSQ